ncbi:hypothetical protein EV401DRAFT_1160185 [Pisolithus croceorrhizus]|nr:hypothetical protein EV401DRAFT_1160185 [Pisolithus croceorrhizus]
MVARVRHCCWSIATSTRRTAWQATERSLDPTHHRSPRCRHKRFPSVDSLHEHRQFIVGVRCLRSSVLSRGYCHSHLSCETPRFPPRDSSHTWSRSIAGSPLATASPTPPALPALHSTPAPTPPPPDPPSEYPCPNLLLYRPLPILGDVEVLTFVIILGPVFVFALALAIHIPRVRYHTWRWTFHQTTATVVSETNLPAKLQDR